jgi:hypothetical protein
MVRTRILLLLATRRPSLKKSLPHTSVVLPSTLVLPDAIDLWSKRENVVYDRMEMCIGRYWWNEQKGCIVQACEPTIGCMSS